MAASLAHDARAELQIDAARVAHDKIRPPHPRAPCPVVAFARDVVIVYYEAIRMANGVAGCSDHVSVRHRLGS